MLTRELLRAIRQIVGAVDLAGMDIVEVSPPYDHAETTAMVANRAALEAISALAVEAARRAGPRPASSPAAADGRRDRRHGHRATATPAAVADALARLYDLDLVEDPGDLDLYLALAARAGGPILELAVGTRPARRAARRGRPRRHRRRPRPGDARPRPRARAAGGRRARPSGLTLVEADLLDLAPAGRPARSASRSSPSTRCCPARDPRRPARGDPDARRRTSRPGGLAVVDVWLPDADDLARFDGRLILEYGRAGSGDRPRRHEGRGRPSTTPRPAIVTLTTIFEEGRPGRGRRPLGPARRASGSSRPTSCATSPRTPASSSRPSPATTTWGRSGRAASGRSSSRVKP